MRISHAPADAAFLSTLLFPVLAAAVTIDCSHIRVAKTSFDLHELGGPQSITHSVDQGVSIVNTTYTIDICKPLVRGDVPKEDYCPNGGTRVCAVQSLFSKEGNTTVLEKVIPIAGELKDQGGGFLDAKWTLLSASPSHSDSEKEGIRVEMKGGYFGSGKDKRQQMAIVEFLCDKERTGLENLDVPQKMKREESNEGSGQDDKNSPSLKFIKYDTTGETADTLRLEWRTKHACEDARGAGDSAHWGLFTWFIIIAFMSTATYLIFGSWLNYNRYGARGWDLLPHGDTIRDAPYLLKDWTRRVLNTVQGGGSRGGYAAV